MSRAIRTVAAVVLAAAFSVAGCGDGSSGGTGGEDKPGAKTEDTGSGY